MIEKLSKEEFKKYRLMKKNCIATKAGINSYGYGCILVNKKKMLAHRLVWRIFKGALPSKLFVCHKCDNRWCINPEHLFIGTAKDNNVDSHQKRRNPRWKRKRNVIKNGKLYLKEQRALRVMELLDERNRQRENYLTLEKIAKKANAPIYVVSDINYGKAWKYLRTETLKNIEELR